MRPRISFVEEKLWKVLKKSRIKFIPQKEYQLGFMDFFVEPNIAIFADGMYWHNYLHGAKKDLDQTKFLRKRGYRVLRFWDEEILSEVGTGVDRIEETIKQNLKISSEATSTKSAN